MSVDTEYQTMHWTLAEGGYFSMRWPHRLTRAGLDEIREVFDLQMRAVERQMDRYDRLREIKASAADAPRQTEADPAGEA